MSATTVLRTILLLVAMLSMNGCQTIMRRAAAHPNALWIITHDMCVSNFDHNGRASPCAEVNLAAGYVVLKDRLGRSQYLLIPTDRISGIEDPAILRTNAHNFFYDAWQNRYRVGAALNKPLGDDQVSLAINPVNARSQNQLHIHIDCIDPDVRESLNRHALDISATWSRWEWHGNDYQVRRLRADQLAQSNPFTLVAQDIPGAAADMGHETIFMTGASGPREKPDNPAKRDPLNPVVQQTAKQSDSTAAAGDVILIVRRLSIAVLDGSGTESLQDHRCRIAQ